MNVHNTTNNFLFLWQYQLWMEVYRNLIWHELICINKIEPMTLQSSPVFSFYLQKFILIFILVFVTTMIHPLLLLYPCYSLLLPLLERSLIFKTLCLLVLNTSLVGRLLPGITYLNYSCSANLLFSLPQNIALIGTLLSILSFSKSSVSFTFICLTFQTIINIDIMLSRHPSSK